MNERAINTITDKLDTIIKLMILIATNDKSQSEQIWLLSAAGLQPKEIANILGTTPNTVRVMLFAMRKQKSKGRKNKV
jgi:DNA-binding NarL/FixJ family response regulator